MHNQLQDLFDKAGFLLHKWNSNEPIVLEHIKPELGDSEQEDAGVVYLHMTDSRGSIHTSLITSKTKVTPIKRLTIPRLELCGAHILA